MITIKIRDFKGNISEKSYELLDLLYEALNSRDYYESLDVEMVEKRFTGRDCLNSVADYFAMEFNDRLDYETDQDLIDAVSKRLMKAC